MITPMIAHPRIDRRMSVAALAATLLATSLFAVPAAEGPERGGEHHRELEHGRRG
jgi:hypothetical protein